MKHLGQQFAHILDQGREKGIEMLPTMPGMARIGKLHVPVSNFNVTHNESNPSLSHFEATTADESGNMYTIGGWNDRDRLYGVIYGPNSGEHGQDVDFNSADDFADVFGRMGQPDEDIQSANAWEMSMRRGAMKRMGGGPGTVHATHMFSNPEMGSSDYLIDPQFGDVRPAKMSFWEAMTSKDEK